jgi:hypothetical protein
MLFAPNEQAGNPYFFKKKKRARNPLLRGALLARAQERPDRTRDAWVQKARCGAMHEGG